ncbi:MAG: acyl-CoA thioesterase [Pseudomonadota bacterium]
MMNSIETVISRQPFIVRRHVRWGDCDPAGVVYTGRFTDYLMGAVMLFFSELAADSHDGRYHDMVAALGVDTPCRGMHLDFRHALWPEDEFDIAVTVGRIGGSSWDIDVTATRCDGPIAFTGRFSPVCINRGGERADARATAIPPALRTRLNAHVASSGIDATTVK